MTTRKPRKPEPIAQPQPMSAERERTLRNAAFDSVEYDKRDHDQYSKATSAVVASDARWGRVIVELFAEIDRLRAELAAKDAEIARLVAACESVIHQCRSWPGQSFEDSSVQEDLTKALTEIGCAPRLACLNCRGLGGFDPDLTRRNVIIPAANGRHKCRDCGGTGKARP